MSTVAAVSCGGESGQPGDAEGDTVPSTNDSAPVDPTPADRTSTSVDVIGSSTAPPPPVGSTVEPTESTFEPVETTVPWSGDDLAILGSAEASGLFAIDDAGRIPVLLDLPEAMSGFDRSFASPPDGAMFVVAFRRDDGAAVSLIVNAVDPATVEDERSFYDANQFRAVEVRGAEAWVGSSVSTGCPELPDDGYNLTALTWYAGSLRLQLEVSPVPECEAGAMSLDDAIAIGESVAACRSLAGEPDCTAAVWPAATG